MSDADRRLRAQARQGRAILRKGRLHDRQGDAVPISGPDAIALVQQLTAESWSLAGLEVPSYTRDTIAWRFVPDHQT
jgi:type II secretory pathway pseudopilin PulG